jgi:hypothetical protein
MVKKPFILRRIVLLGILSMGILCVIPTVIYIERDRSFDAPPNIAQRNTPEDWAAHVKIGLIGDSWIAGGKLDQAIRDAMLNAGVPAEVVSSGHPGAKSRQIYRDIHSDESKPFSSKKLFMDEDLDYLVVVAGVNDTAGHIGRDFYAYHMLCIIKAAQTLGIHPVILEVPEYGIEHTPAEGVMSFMKRLIYRAFFDGMQDNVISAYRESLQNQLTPKMLEDMTIVPFSPLVQNYSQSIDLYANPSHLNKKGCQKLGFLIAKNIVESHNKRLERTKAAPNNRH